MLLVTNPYYWVVNDEIKEELDTADFARFKLTSLDVIDLHKLFPDDYDEGQAILPAFSEEVWQSRMYNDLLKVIAEDEARAFFVSKINKCLVAPYDGGIDFVLKDETTRNKYMQKYIEWLPKNDTGL